MKRNIAVKKALIDRQVPDYRSAIDANINPTKLSKIISGLAIPTQEEKSGWQKSLSVPSMNCFLNPILIPRWLYERRRQTSR